MKKNPFGQILSKLPRTAKFLGAKGYRDSNREEYRISYLYRGKVYNQSFEVKGGILWEHVDS